MKKLLIVEDEPAYTKLLHDQLTSCGYKVIEAKNGQEGLASAKSNHPDLILLDIKMPIMGGMEMLTELRKDPYGKLAKVLILTNLEPDDKIIRTILKDRPSYYLLKSDIQLSDLLDKIEALLCPSSVS